ncbi:uncharacterized protein LOC107830662 [Nicotiana tabacum]|uniref:Uncharacterized protein LOC107830662 n=1 Tax=Nicotiana tabacum TaxID=4097 RepID=A0AC58U278_TOBAC
MAPFDSLCSRSGRSHIGCFGEREAEFIGLDLMHQAMEKVKIIKEWKIGQVAYRLELPLELSLVHRVFHVSMLKKVVGDPSLIVPVEAIEVNVELTYEEIPVAIIDRKVRKMRNKKIASVKVLWQNQQAEEATCEAKKDMERKYPHLFVEPNGCA